ncbi:hypothetical protein HRR83_009415 [Exophiala dermatitidis]|uniref:Pre-mRNA polyadenylation factor Fip1 domain-containing protein n=2 Tax=Exophiala dermatitidis TaxID=5970 RepID=H6BLQ9_EXODN|nr:uncharacterized protein HMPREF1120_01102 [Exophiala dermatitidis NIH/UT8656]KAJ4502868.1 hypothetical protein HRR73_009296 [Exophiala dermatitidis]EHY52897.1 hypothetical protein HMPREF1120_01102 [Exophiala dermatitidis NIH/UT8656]KAJ4512290.1 hypothetical protein HRR75_005191 [Exophiala dermatitidis]KAJ4515197.1 hypothetical protein HRR74_005663 [Exophiala dermatitidis]KAJ4536245.1 hypothetical protein HRR78_008594 [Exophiala dermatitidis]
MMDSDEDDIYPTHQDETNGHGAPQGEVKMNDVEDGEEEGEEVEEESDDDVDFIIDAKDEPQAEQPGSQSKRPSSLAPAATADNLRKSSSTPTPAGTQIKPSGTPVAGTTAGDDTQTRRDTSQPPNERPGTDYPPRHTSKIDPNGNPIHPATGKPILSTDLDVDFPTESSKPWRKPGADITDYFNYGFDEFTWASYCLKQQQMPKEVQQIRQEAEQLKAFVEGIPGGGIPGMPPLPGATAPSGGPGPAPAPAPGGDMSQMGMPSEAQMQQMFAAMTSQGMDPMSMDPSQFMQFMAAAGGPGMMGGPQGGPPTGPSGGFGGGGGGSGFDQGGGGGPGGGGGGGFGRPRGKGGRRNW